MDGVWWKLTLQYGVRSTKLKQSGKRGGCGRLRGKLVEVEGATGCQTTTQPPSGHGDGGGTRLITRISTVSCYWAVLQKLFILQTRLAAPNNPTEAANNASCIAAFATRVTTLSPPAGASLRITLGGPSSIRCALPCLFSASILGTRYLGMQPCQEPRQLTNCAFIPIDAGCAPGLRQQKHHRISWTRSDATMPCRLGARCRGGKNIASRNTVK